MPTIRISDKTKKDFDSYQILLQYESKEKQDQDRTLTYLLKRVPELEAQLKLQQKQK